MTGLFAEEKHVAMQEEVEVGFERSDRRMSESRVHRPAYKYFTRRAGDRSRTILEAVHY